MRFFLVFLFLSAGALAEVSLKTPGKFEQCISRIGPTLPNSFDPDARVKKAIENCSIGNSVSNVSYKVSQKSSGLYLIDVNFQNGKKQRNLKQYFSSNSALAFKGLDAICNVNDQFVNLAELEKKLLSSAINTANEEVSCSDEKNSEARKLKLPMKVGFSYDISENITTSYVNFEETPTIAGPGGSVGFKTMSDGKCQRICSPGQILSEDPRLSAAAQLTNFQKVADAEFFEMSRCMDCPEGYATNNYSNACLDKNGCELGTQLRTFKMARKEESDFEGRNGVSPEEVITKTACVASCAPDQVWNPKSRNCEFTKGKECSRCQQIIESLRKDGQRDLSSALVGKCSGDKMQTLWKMYIDRQIQDWQEEYDGCSQEQDPDNKRASYCGGDPLKEVRHGRRPTNFGQWLYDDAQLDAPFNGLCKPPEKGEAISSDAMDVMTQSPLLKFSERFRVLCVDSKICK